jgi:hypothetical protein
MAIVIERRAQGYDAWVTPLHGDRIPWATDTSVEARELVRLLLAHGCHQQDIGDAFYEADPAWVLRLEDEDRS